MKTFTIGTNDANQRFDKYLKKLLPNASVSFLYKMLRKKNITLDGKKATGKESKRACSRACCRPRRCSKSAPHSASRARTSSPCRARFRRR